MHLHMYVVSITYEQTKDSLENITWSELYKLKRSVAKGGAQGKHVNAPQNFVTKVLETGHTVYSPYLRISESVLSPQL